MNIEEFIKSSEGMEILFNDLTNEYPNKNTYRFLLSPSGTFDVPGVYLEAGYRNEHKDLNDFDNCFSLSLSDMEELHNKLSKVIYYRKYIQEVLRLSFIIEEQKEDEYPDNCIKCTDDVRFIDDPKNYLYGVAVIPYTTVIDNTTVTSVIITPNLYSIKNIDNYLDNIPNWVINYPKDKVKEEYIKAQAKLQSVHDKNNSIKDKIYKI